MGIRLSAIVAGTMLAASCAALAQSAPFDKIVVFGDSLSDVGNDYIATKGTEPAAPYHDGRFSNGPIWIESVAAAYGMVLKPSLAGGTDYAYGGSETTADVSTSYGTIPSLYNQAAAYLLAAHGHADPNTLYVVWGGSNDLIDTAESNPAGLLSLPVRFAEATKLTINMLYRAGARSFMVPQVPDVGLSPLALGLGSTLSAAASDAASAMDLALAEVLLTEEDKGLNIYHLHAYLLQQELTSAADVGQSTGQGYFLLGNVTQPCLTGTATVCANPTQYFYWDDLHPTATVHAMLGVAALDRLPR